jgi:hypothetical protein
MGASQDDLEAQEQREAQRKAAELAELQAAEEREREEKARKEAVEKATALWAHGGLLLEGEQPQDEAKKPQKKAELTEEEKKKKMEEAASAWFGAEDIKTAKPKFVLKKEKSGLTSRQDSARRSKSNIETARRKSAVSSFVFDFDFDFDF